MRNACTLGTFALFTSLLAALLAAQQTPPAAAPPAAAANNDALVIYSAGIDGLFVDPKDAGLLRALKLLDERVMELPGEFDANDVPGPALQLALQLLASPMSLRAGLLDMNGQPEGPPFYGQLSFYGPADTAADFAGRFTALLAEHGAPPATPAANMPGMKTVDADGVPLYFGTMKTAKDAAFVLAVNKVGSADAPTAATGLPKDIKPVVSFTLDLQKLQPLMEMLLANAGEGEEAQMIRAQLAMFGVYGPNAGQLQLAAGHGPDRSHAWAKYTNYRKMLESGGALPEGALTAADLSRVPADATYAQVSKVNLNGLMNLARTMASEGMKQSGAGGADAAADPFKFVEDMVGIHPQRDLVDHLGQTMGSYMSDSTGGGGLASLVCFAQVKNADGLNETLGRIRGMINQLAQDKARGYVRVGERDLGDQKAMTLVFPGLPVPLEICWAIADGYLYAAGSPNALQAAIAQGKSGKGSLADNTRFKDMGGGDLKDAMQVTFIDTPRMIPLGYGMVSMGMSALANAVRSPTDLQRDAGVIMPTFADLSKNAKANVMILRLVGEDLVMNNQYDRSALVNWCGLAGAMGGMGGVMAAAAAAGAIMPAMTRAQAVALDVQSMSKLRNISMGYMMYATDNKDALPTSAAELTAAGYFEPDMFHSPAGPAPDEHGDYWLNTKGGKMSAVDRPDVYIIAYDRAMFATGDKVAVAFLDGHVEQLAIDEFRTLTQSDANKALDFKLPF